MTAIAHHHLHYNHRLLLLHHSSPGWHNFPTSILGKGRSCNVVSSMASGIQHWQIINYCSDYSLSLFMPLVAKAFGERCTHYLPFEESATFTFKIISCRKMSSFHLFHITSFSIHYKRTNYYYHPNGFYYLDFGFNYMTVQFSSIGSFTLLGNSSMRFKFSGESSKFKN